MNIRFATPQDKEQILKLMDEFNALIKAEDIPSKIGGAMFDEIINRDDNKIFVVEENNKIIGTATVYLLPNIRHGRHQGYVKDFFITEKMRRKGVGTTLFEEIKNYCHKNNVKVIKLATGNELLDAQEFYKEKGGKTTEVFFKFDI